MLRDWRATRGMSQMDVALRAGFSTRHVSFIETGRTQPSRQALLAIAETLARAERELGEAPDDSAGIALLEEIRGYAGPPAPSASRGPLAFDLLLPVHIRKADIDVRLFSTIMTLGTPRDVTSQELRIETFFPADERSEAVWTTLTGT